MNYNIFILGVIISGFAALMHGIITDDIILTLGSFTFILAVATYDSLSGWL